MGSISISAALEELSSLGFQPERGMLAKDDWRLVCRREWWTLSRPWPAERAPLDRSGPGLWKHSAGREVFEWPEQACLFEADTESKISLSPIVEWAWRTTENSPMEEWQAPCLTEVESWFGREEYAIGNGHFLRQVDLRCEEGHLALETPIVHCVAEELPADRRAWLLRLALDAQGAWPLVRLREEAGNGWVAEVNLTGAPLPTARRLISAGLASLRGAVISLVEGAELLADPMRVSDALAFSSGKNS